jgi:hypothetical protein
MTAVAATPNMFVPRQQLISMNLDDYVDLKERAESVTLLDLGTTIIEMVKHSQFGMMLLVNTSGESNAAFRL